MKYPYVLALKEPTSNKPTLIYFKAYLRAENKRFKYSTGEKIHPKYWDFIIKKPKELTGRTKTAIELRSINRQLQRYVNKYEDIRSYYDNINEILTISTLKNEFDKEFRLGFSGVNEFFRSYDEFLQSKRERKENSQGTIYRYEYLKSLLKDFANIKKYNLRFSTINSNFEDKFLGYCRANKGHSNNTIGRNIGLLKTFMYWAERVGKHTNTAFKSIRKTKHEPDEIALTDKQFEQLFKHDLSHNKRLEKVRDVFIFGCSTGLRYSDYHRVGKRHINDGNIRLTSKKDRTNRDIPLNDYSIYILKKYNYELPRISEQKFNKYIKETSKDAGLDHETEKTIYVGNEAQTQQLYLWERISSHVARRTFITLSLQNGMNPELVMKITGHKTYENFKKYIKLSDKFKKQEMQRVWRFGGFEYDQRERLKLVTG